MEGEEPLGVFAEVVVAFARGVVVGFDGGKDPELEAEPFSLKAPCAMIKGEESPHDR